MAGIDTDILMSDAAKSQYDASKESQTTAVSNKGDMLWRSSRPYPTTSHRLR